MYLVVMNVGKYSLIIWFYIYILLYNFLIPYSSDFFALK